MAFLFLGCYDITCEEKRGKKKHEVFYKRIVKYKGKDNMGAVWENPAAAAVPGKYRWCLNMAVSKNAEEFSEEYYKDLYTRRRRAFVKQMKEEEGEAFDKIAAEVAFMRHHEETVKRMERISGAAVPPAKWIAWMQTRSVCWQP